MKRVKSKLNKTLFISLLIVSFNCNESNHSTKIHEVFTESQEFFENQINLDREIKKAIDSLGMGKPFIIPKRIKDEKLLATIIDKSEDLESSDKLFFLVYNIKYKKIESFLENPFAADRYDASDFDYENGNFFFAKNGDAKFIYEYNQKEIRMDSISIPEVYQDYIGTPVVDNNIIYFSSSLLGSVIYNLTSRRWVSHRNRYSETINYVYSQIVLSPEGQKSIVSGERNHDKIMCYLIDSLQSRLDSFSIKEIPLTLAGQLKIFPVDDDFVVVNQNEVSLFKGSPLVEAGKVIFEKNLVAAFLLSDHRLLYVSSSKEFSKIQCVQINGLKVLWSFDIPIHFGINYDITVNREKENIIFLNKDMLESFDFAGQHMRTTKASGLKGFYNMVDIKTGKVYVISYHDSYLMW